MASRRRGFEALARLGLSFDFQTPWWNLPEAIALANDYPNVQIILNHAGLPSKRDPASLARWEAAIRRFATCHNAVVKLSGMGVPGAPWMSDSTVWIVRTALAIFGADRTMFGSNFPVDSLSASYDEILSGFKTILADHPAEEQQAFFAGTVRRVYVLGP